MPGCLMPRFLPSFRLLPNITCPALSALNTSRRYNATYARAIVFSKPGDPAQVLECRTAREPLPQLGECDVQIRALLSPVHPADLNVIEGKYPEKPRPRTGFSYNPEDVVFIPGNEGLAIIEAVGAREPRLKVGDWVVMHRAQSGTWAQRQVVDRMDVIALNEEARGVGREAASMLMVNPMTAHGLLTEVVKPKRKEWVIQNGANSAVGRCVIQIAAANEYKTLNFVRNRPDIEDLKLELKALGATEVFTYEELADKSFKQTWASISGDNPARLALNCVGGKPTAKMATLLDDNGHLISYGGMSKEPLTIPVGSHIFKNLTSHGYWQTKWYKDHTRLVATLQLGCIVKWILNGDLKPPPSEIIPLKGSDEEVTQTVRNLIGRIQRGEMKRKPLLQWEE